MPRYSLGGTPAAAAASVPSGVPSASTSNGNTYDKAYSDAFTANLTKLRRTWKFAAVCQFLFTFEEAFGMSGFKSATLEHDLAASTYEVIPDLMRRLLYTLTLDGKVTNENWQEYLRDQYAYRLAEDGLPNPLGSPEDLKQWEDFSLASKVRSLYDICEWQMADPERFRKLVRNEEDAENWRIYPIGWDAQENTYWLFDDNRLWVQHPPPPPPPKAKKARPAKKGSKRAKAEAAAAKKKAKAEQEKAKREKAAAARKTGKRVASASGPLAGDTPNKRTRLGRASLSASSPNASAAYSPPRSSRRLRGQDSDGWEPIPADLLAEVNAADDSKVDPAGDDDESELSEPPDEVEEGDLTMRTEADESVDESKMDIDQPSSLPKSGEDDEETWLEFETIAITRAEWEVLGARFAKSKHPDEKALHKILSTDIVPRVLEDIAEAEKAAALEAALAARKRSSRIAMKESEREEREREAEAKAKMEERMRLIRQEEAEKRAKEDEALEEEKKREERAREKEERLRGREERAREREREAEAKAIREIEERERREKMREMRKRKREMIASGELQEDESESQAKDEGGEDQDEDWELGCEICHKSGRNPELGPDEQIVCCESCLVWQHTKCWDDFDAWLTQPPRNWDEEDFFCTKCSARREPDRINRDEIAGKIDAFRLARGLVIAEVKVESDAQPETDSRPVAEPPTLSDKVQLNGSGTMESPAVEVQQPQPPQMQPQQIQALQPLPPSQLSAPAPSASGDGSSGDGSSAPMNGLPSSPAERNTFNANGSTKAQEPAQAQPARTHDNSMGPPTSQFRSPSMSSAAPVRPGAVNPVPVTSQSPGQSAAPPARFASFGPDGNVMMSSPSEGPRTVAQATQSVASPPQSPSHSFTGSAPSVEGQTSSPGPLASPKLQVSGNGNSNGAARSSKNAGAAGSFPIRRPNSSVARSPLSGPSISPGSNGGPPPMSLGEALTGSGTIGSNSMRGVSPSPSGGSGRSLGPLPRFNSGASDGTPLAATAISSSSQGSVSTNAINGNLHKNLAASQPHGVAPTPSVQTGPTPSPIARPPPPGAPTSGIGAVSPTPSPAGKDVGIGKGESGDRSSSPGPRQGSLAEGKVIPAVDAHGNQAVNP
ncbi:hypothetical protein BCV69DRAFT_300049 [Microstroma glucosiphilum]|uniref:PHD-type domain-containing protein n=1 Tax=Pseudomicrostroma glucosiphilum TaxID=1684307 RepID=A0A316U5K9_9BASI|nr:hypothetical protein BCV69DRAFT_300049 [Pseudomicrostroma glucosiphilum]PWN19741.1 hypothetical protein BCV69DRAFT_300049 [Pseudomicrostroma glucosiphilum]